MSRSKPKCALCVVGVIKDIETNEVLNVFEYDTITKEEMEISFDHCPICGHEIEEVDDES